MWSISVIPPDIKRQTVIALCTVHLFDSFAFLFAMIILLEPIWVNYFTSILIEPQGFGIDECAIYGDYFYLEALARYLVLGFKKHW